VLRIVARDLEAERSYRLLTGIVVPRPIAWVSSLSAGGTVNLAPFSAFTFVSPKPPLLAISVGRKGRVYKDTGDEHSRPRRLFPDAACRIVNAPPHPPAYAGSCLSGPEGQRGLG
jgi:Flavin reductase like domain